MFRPIEDIEQKSNPVLDIGGWVSDYKEAFLEHPHDTSQLTLVLPDDCLVVAGPTRLYHAGGNGKQAEFNGAEDYDRFSIVGFANQISVSETRNVQPLKAIGSRRHIFAATNAPVQISIGRLMILGINTMRSLYGKTKFGVDIYDRNSKYANLAKSDEASWFSNLEEDLFRVPIGLGFIYNTPATLAGAGNSLNATNAGAEYFEVCTVVSKQQSLQAGQAFVMEQVQLMADRCVAWPKAMGINALSRTEDHRKRQVHSVSKMDA